MSLLALWDPDTCNSKQETTKCVKGFFVPVLCHVSYMVDGYETTGTARKGKVLLAMTCDYDKELHHCCHDAGYLRHDTQQVLIALQEHFGRHIQPPPSVPHTCHPTTRRQAGSVATAVATQAAACVISQTPFVCEVTAVNGSRKPNGNWLDDRNGRHYADTIAKFIPLRFDYHNPKCFLKHHNNRSGHARST